MDMAVLKMRFHGSKRGSGVVSKRQVSKAGQLVTREGSETRRVSRSGNGGVIGSRGQGIVREGRRRGSRGVGRVGPRSL